MATEFCEYTGSAYQPAFCGPLVWVIYGLWHAEECNRRYFNPTKCTKESCLPKCLG